MTYFTRLFCCTGFPTARREHPLRDGRLAHQAEERHLTLRGSGLLSVVVDPRGPAEVVDEQQQADLVHLAALTERERLAHEPRQALPQHVVPALQVVGLPALLAAGAVLLLGNHFAVGVPEVGVAQQAPEGGRDTLPQPPAGPLAPVAHGERDDLPGPPTQREPDLPLVGTVRDERPQFVKFQHVAFSRRAQCPAQGRQRPGFF